MTDFVARGSIVRRIWGNVDMVLLVFAGSAAEFALSRAVDWLFFTGKVPNDPMGRLFATARYAQEIVFADELTASATLRRIRAAHQVIERRRGETIPDWAHRDVLYMLIHYSERAHELLVRRLTIAERNELYDVFYRVGMGLGISDLPRGYAEWRIDRERHLHRDLIHGDFTDALYAAYRRQLGPWRYRLLLLAQSMLVPTHVRALLRMKPVELLRPALRLHPLLAHAGLSPVIQRLLIPPQHLGSVHALNQRKPGVMTYNVPHPLRRGNEARCSVR